MIMQNVALVTGASNGIGLELARIHAQKGGDLVLVARSEDKLIKLKNELESEYGISALVIAEDLSDSHSAQRIFELTEQQSIQIDVLINNAGFGGHGLFYQRELTSEQAMIQVNITMLTNLSHLYLNGMVKRNKGKILNVSSTASFMPGPLQAVYYATKAYVTSFSQALAEELKATNVTVTVLCPGAVATGFASAGNLEETGLWKDAKTPASCAKIAYKDMEKGKLVSFNETMLKFMLTWIVPLLPRKMVLTMSRQLMEKKR